MLGKVLLFILICILCLYLLSNLNIKKKKVAGNKIYKGWRRNGFEGSRDNRFGKWGSNGWGSGNERDTGNYDNAPNSWSYDDYKDNSGQERYPENIPDRSPDYDYSGRNNPNSYDSPQSRPASNNWQSGGPPPSNRQPPETDTQEGGRKKVKGDINWPKGGRKPDGKLGPFNPYENENGEEGPSFSLRKHNTNTSHSKSLIHLLENAKFAEFGNFKKQASPSTHTNQNEEDTNPWYNHDKIDPEIEILPSSFDPLKGHTIDPWKLEVYSQTEGIRTDNESYIYDDALYTIETFIFLDTELIEKRKIDETFEAYVIKLIMQTNNYFTRETLRHPIIIALTGIDKLDMSKIGSNSKTLRGHNVHLLNEDFCAFSKKYFQKMKRKHPDISVLLTTAQMCLEFNCEVIGSTRFSSMCTRGSNDCMVIKDIGYSTTDIIAYEFGHALGMSHDNKKNCGKYYMSSNIKSTFMEFSTDNYVNQNRYWSECSARGLDEYMKIIGGNCLKNKPKINWLNTVNWTNLVGSYTTLNQHCQLVNNPSYKQCPNESSCGILFCGNSSLNCQRQQGSQLEGIICYKNGYCFRGQCYKNKPNAIHGSWGKWSSYGQCTRPCGGGVQISIRTCDSPKPQNDGRYCQGPGKRYKSCNTEPCPIDEPDFRTQQCQKEGFKTAIYEQNETCALSCTNHGTVGKRFGFVIDGTPCSLKSCGICINGICRKAGCDNVIGSKVRSYRKKQKNSNGPIFVRIRKMLESFSKIKWENDNILWKIKQILKAHWIT